jgi:hypothetical protein
MAGRGPHQFRTRINLIEEITCQGFIWLLIGYRTRNTARCRSLLDFNSLKLPFNIRSGDRLSLVIVIVDSAVLARIG